MCEKVGIIGKLPDGTKLVDKVATAIGLVVVGTLVLNMMDGQKEGVLNAAVDDKVGKK